MKILERWFIILMLLGGMAHGQIVNPGGGGGGDAPLDQRPAEAEVYMATNIILDAQGYGFFGTNQVRLHQDLVDPESGINLTYSLDGSTTNTAQVKIPSDAPSDGSQYARKDGAWEAVASTGGGGTAVNTIHCKDAASWLTTTPQPGTTNALDGSGEVVHCWNGIDGDNTQAKYKIRPWTFSCTSGTTYTVTASGHAGGDLSGTNVALCLNIEGAWVSTGTVVNSTGMDATDYKTFDRQSVSNAYTAVSESFGVFPMAYSPAGTNGEITIFDYMDVTVAEQ